MEGGSANDYDYVSGDPVNGIDLAGTAAIRLNRRVTTIRTQYGVLRITRGRAYTNKHGHLSIHYTVYFAAKSQYRFNIAKTSVRVSGRLPGGGRSTWDDHTTEDKINRTGRSDYAHTYIAIRPGSQFHVAAFMDFINPYPYDAAHFIAGDRYSGDFIG